MKDIHALLSHLSKDELIKLIHLAKCGKLVGIDTNGMTKRDVINHLVGVRCPEVRRVIDDYRAKLSSNAS
jgi:hypothetical protein